MGADGLTPFYPLEQIMCQSKVENIAGGTMEACRLVIFRSGLRRIADDLKMPRRGIHPTLGIPVPYPAPAARRKDVDEQALLAVLAEDYRVNPGLHMSREDIVELFDVDDNGLDGLLVSLEAQGLVKLSRSKKGIQLIKATYEGLTRAHPNEYYRWFPEWAKKGEREYSKGRVVDFSYSSNIAGANWRCAAAKARGGAERIFTRRRPLEEDLRLKRFFTP